MHVWFDGQSESYVKAFLIADICVDSIHICTVKTLLHQSRFRVLQGLCEQAMEVFKSMEKDGVELNLSMLNLLINAFGVAGRHIEAFSVFDYILEVVRSHPEQCMARAEFLVKFSSWCYRNLNYGRHHLFCGSTMPVCAFVFRI